MGELLSINSAQQMVKTDPEGQQVSLENYYIRSFPKNTVQAGKYDAIVDKDSVYLTVLDDETRQRVEQELGQGNSVVISAAVMRYIIEKLAEEGEFVGGLDR